MTSLICCKLQKGNAATGKISPWNLQVNLAQSLSKGDWRNWDSQVGRRQSQLDALKTKSSMAPKYLSKEETCSTVSPSAWGPLVSRQEHPDPVRDAYLNPKPVNPVNDTLSSCSWGKNAIFLSQLLFIWGIEEAENIHPGGEKKMAFKFIHWKYVLGTYFVSGPHHREQGRETRNKQLHVWAELQYTGRFDLVYLGSRKDS